jgi:azurin
MTITRPTLAPGDTCVLASSRLVGGGETTSVTFASSIRRNGGDYRYLCTFPGHNALLHGIFRFG